MLEIEIGSSRWHCVGNWLWNSLWTVVQQTGMNEWRQVKVSAYNALLKNALENRPLYRLRSWCKDNIKMVTRLYN
jgi:hypothetical protein